MDVGLPEVFCLGVDMRFVVVFHGRVVVLVRMSGRHVPPLGAVPEVVHDVGVLVGVNNGIMGVFHDLPLAICCVREPVRSARLTGLAAAAPTWHVASLAAPAGLLYRLACPGGTSLPVPSVHGAGPMSIGTMVTFGRRGLWSGLGVPDTPAGGAPRSGSGAIVPLPQLSRQGVPEPGRDASWRVKKGFYLAVVAEGGDG